MINRYQAIGRLIMNLRNGRFLEDEAEFEAELKAEFNEVTLQLGAMWLEKEEGIDYCLDFHRAEAARLRAFVGFEEGKPNVTLRMLMYEELTEQMRRLDIMIDGVDAK